MKFILILLLGALIVGPLLVLYNLGVKYKKQKEIKSKRRAEMQKKMDAAKMASKYKTRF